mmetsp:Transcript_11027/g.26771  ORF Transcript_11027/g.26771 Transcript_11027/m.26771 type:complete len:648 (+) Transcript_11027:125-2068(+)
MVSLGWGRGFALLLSVLAVQHSSAALYGEACSSDKDCTTSVEVVGRPSAFCSMMFVDRTPLNDAVNPSKPVVTYGKCVECVEDCDCGVGQRCGIPILSEDQVAIQGTSAPFTSAYSAVPSWLWKRLQNVGKAVDGLPINSKCLAYTYNEEGATPGYCTPAESYAAQADSFWKIVKEVPTNRDGTQGDPHDVLRKPMATNTWTHTGIPKAMVKPNAGEARWCGEVNVFHGIGQDAFAPAFQSVVDLRARNIPDYTSKNNMARYSTGDLYDTAAICPKVVEADMVKCDQCREDCGTADRMPEGVLSFFDSFRFSSSAVSTSNIIDRGEDLSTACRAYDWSGQAFPGKYIGARESDEYTENLAECQACMGKCPDNAAYDGSDSQKTCIGACLLPYVSCTIDVKVGVSGYGPRGWTDAGETTRPVGYSFNDAHTRLECNKRLSVNSGTYAYDPYDPIGSIHPTIIPDSPLHRFFRLATPLVGASDVVGGPKEVPEGGPSGTSEAFTLSMSTSAVAWEGTCRSGTCHVCVEGNQRCESGRGIPQVCQHGRWMESRLGKELVTWNEDLIVQTTLTAIAGVIMLLLCALTAMGCVKLTSSGSDGGHMKYASPPNTGFQGNGGAPGVQAFSAPEGVFPTYPAAGAGGTYGDAGNV